MEVSEKEALLNLFYTEEQRKEETKTNGELYDGIVKDLLTEWGENRGLYHNDKQAFISEWADSHTEVYTTEIFSWYASDCRLYYLADEAIQEFGYPKENGGIVKALQMGIYHFLENFAHEILENEPEEETEEAVQDEQPLYA